MRQRAGGAILLVALLAALPVWAANVGHYVLGDTTAKTPGKVQPGLLLMGGGDRNQDALHWFLQHAGNGHIVVLRASLGGEIGEEFYHKIGGIQSVETFVFKDRDAAFARRSWPRSSMPTASSWPVAIRPGMCATGAARRWRRR